MTTLDSMATHAEPSPLERLQSLVHAQAGPAREWRTSFRLYAPSLLPFRSCWESLPARRR